MMLVAVEVVTIMKRAVVVVEVMAMINERLWWCWQR